MNTVERQEVLPEPPKEELTFHVEVTLCTKAQRCEGSWEEPCQVVGSGSWEGMWGEMKCKKQAVTQPGRCLVQWLRIYLPCRAGDAGPIPVGRTKVPHATGQLSPHTAAREPAQSRRHAPQLEKPVCHNQKQKACTPKWTALSTNKETKSEDNVIWPNLEWQMWMCYGRWYLVGWNYHLCWILSMSPCRHTPSLFLLFCALGGWLLSAGPKGSFWSWTSCIRVTWGALKSIHIF